MKNYDDMVTTNVYDGNGVKIGVMYFDDFNNTYFVSAESNVYDYYEGTYDEDYK